MAASLDTAAPGAFVLREGMRGVPPGFGAVPAASLRARNWHPVDGAMALPLLTLDLPVFSENWAAMRAIATHFGAAVAPHAKTPMAPDLARMMVESGAWGASVADLRQAAVMRAGGISRLIIANQIGGRAAISRLAQFLARYPECETHLFVDDPAVVAEIASLWRARPDLPALGLLLEVGCGRGGVADAAQAEAVVDALAETDGRLRFSGVAAYEGTAMRESEAETVANLADLFERIGEALRIVRRQNPIDPLILTAGGSSLFDRVIALAAPILQTDGRAQLMLRSGACYYSDHGGIARRLEALAARGLVSAATGGGNPFRPALRLWAEVLSRNVAGRAICGLGLRDTSHDQGPPVPLRLWREGKVAADLAGHASIAKLNDQHCFVSYDAAIELKVGDVVEFGISHPCTCIDKHAVIYGLGRDGRIETAFQTHFG